MSYFNMLPAGRLFKQPHSSQYSQFRIMEVVTYEPKADTPKLYYAAIDNDYSCGCLLKIQLIIKNSDGWVNVVKLCTNARKKFSDWKCTKQAQEIIQNFTRKYRR